MMPLPPKEALTVEIAKKGLGITLDAISSLINTTRHHHKAKSVLKNTEVVSRNIQSIRYVKTVLSLEVSLDLVDFYYPTKVQHKTWFDHLNRQNTTRVIDSLDDFGDVRGVLLTGTVGQGKSIFMRYLVIGELARGEKLPLFYELRKFQDNKTLEANLLSELEVMGFKMEPQVFHLLCKSGAITLFLDGLDEVHSRNRASVVSQAENFIKQHPKISVLLSSRPNTGAEGSPHFVNYALSTLSLDEYPQVIEAMVEDSERSQAIIAALEQSQIRTILTTPLMVALAIIRYRLEESLPDSEIGFFSNLFNLLIERHDTWKSGFKRAKKSNVGDSKLALTFEGICFYSKVNRLEGEFSRGRLLELASKTMRANNITGIVDDAVDDIVEITNLVIEDGSHCKFAHRSIQEYFAASYVVGRVEDDAKAFYVSMLSKWKDWNEELHFLSSLDRHRYLKHFAIPGKASVLKSDLKNLPAKWANDGRGFDLVLDAVLEKTPLLRDAVKNGGNFFVRDFFTMRVSTDFDFRDERVFELTDLYYYDTFAVDMVTLFNLEERKPKNHNTSSKKTHLLSLTDGLQFIKDSENYSACVAACDRTCEAIHDSLLKDVAELARLEAANQDFSF